MLFYSETPVVQRGDVVFTASLEERVLRNPVKEDRAEEDLNEIWTRGYVCPLEQE
jgi:hypothetical protein